MTARHMILSLAVVMALSACGGGGTDDTPSAGESLAIETYVGSELSLDEQRCILEGTRVLTIEPERITADDLTTDEDGELLAVVAECLEDPASFEPFVDSFIAGAAEGGTNLTRSEAQCAIRALETVAD